MQSRENPLWSEVLRLVWIALALATLLALATYSPTDPSWSTWSSKVNFKNWMGRTGSIVSDLLFQLFGLASFTIALLLGLYAFTKNRFYPEVGDTKLSFFSPLFFLLSIGALIQCTFPRSWTP